MLCVPSDFISIQRLMNTGQNIFFHQAKDPTSDGQIVQHVWVPVLLAAVFAYVIAECFIDVYGVSRTFSFENSIKYVKAFLCILK